CHDIERPALNLAQVAPDPIDLVSEFDPRDSPANVLLSVENDRFRVVLSCNQILCEVQRCIWKPATLTKAPSGPKGLPAEFASKGELIPGSSPESFGLVEGECGEALE